MIKYEIRVGACASLLLVFGSVEFGGIDHIGQRRFGLLPLSGLEATVGVNPQLLWLEVLQHLLDTILDFLLRWNTRGVDVVDTRSDVSWICFVNEDLEELGIRFAVLDREDISIQSCNGVEEVLEFRVAEMAVDLCAIFNASSGQIERVHSPLQVSFPLLACSEGEAFTERWLIDLDDVNTSSLKVNDLISEGQCELLSLNRLMNIVTGNDHLRQVIGPVSMPFIGFLEIDAAYLDSLTVIGAGREMSPTMMGGRTHREPYDWTQAWVVKT